MRQQKEFHKSIMRAFVLIAVATFYVLPGVRANRCRHSFTYTSGQQQSFTYAHASGEC